MTDSELLVKVDAAIDALVTGNVQAYSIAGRSLTKLSLTDLYKMRKELSASVNRSTRGMFYAAQMREPE